jgi:hypothetical protein
MMGTDPGRLLKAKREAIAIMAARPFLKKKLERGVLHETLGA